MSKPSNNRPKPKAKQPIDPLLAKRLEQLNTRRPAGAPLPPPAPGTAAGYKGSSAAAKQSQAQSRPAAVPAGATPEQAAKLAAAAERAAAARAAKQGGARPGTAVPPSRRNKPAAASKVASVAISAATTIALAGMFARQDGQSTDSVTLTAGTDPLVAATPTTAAAAASATTVTTAAAGAGVTTPTTAAPVTTAAAAAPAGIADGTYVGNASQNRFGVVQVQVVYSGGQLTDVQILSYPDGDRRSIAINQRALPTLIDETIQAQGSDIYGVSGATYTSRSYYKSLQSAIDNAKQASGIS